MKPIPPTSTSTTRRDDLAAVIRDGTLFQSQSPTEMDDAPLLNTVRQFLADMRSAEIPHVLVGGLALLQHVEGRNTRVIDLVIAVDDLSRIPGIEIEEQNEWFATGTYRSLRVDLLFTANPLFAHVARDHAGVRDFVGGKMRCATPFGIAILKLFALPSLYRQGQIDRAGLYETDLLLLLRYDEHITDAGLLETLEEHMSPTDITALSEVLADVRARIRRGERFPGEGS